MILQKVKEKEEKEKQLEIEQRDIEKQLDMK